MYKDSELIKEYNSITEAAKDISKQLNKKQNNVLSNIGHCLKKYKNQEIAYGFKWKYA